MAGKKPAKVNSVNKIKQAIQLGKATLHISSGGDTYHICPSCGKKTGKGIIYEHQDLLYCKRNCIPKI